MVSFGILAEASQPEPCRNPNTRGAAVCGVKVPCALCSGEGRVLIRIQKLGAPWLLYSGGMIWYTFPEHADGIRLCAQCSSSLVCKASAVQNSGETYSIHEQVGKPKAVMG